MIDIHSHILFGIDDGARTIEESMAMLRLASNNGTKAIIATPHYSRNKYFYKLEEYDKLFVTIIKEIKKEELSIKIYQGQEAFLDEYLLEDLLSGKCKTLNGSRYVLIEIFSNVSFQIIKKMLFDILIKGYVPIIAHCERIIKKKKDYNKIIELREMGCLLQINASVLLKRNKPFLRRWLIKRIKDETINFISSDAHNTTYRNPILSSTYKLVEKKVGISIANKIFIYNPERILIDKELK